MAIQHLTNRKFTHAIQLADIHIRLTRRHEEYKKVFESLYESVSSTPVTTVVFVLGDVVNSKVDLSPECVDMTAELLYKLAALRPTVLLAGNHDTNLTNRSRMDSLGPVVSALKNANLYYLKESGLYGLGNICINNYSVFDEPDKYMKGSDIPEIYRNQFEHFIVTYHGQVDGAKTDLGFTLVNPAITVDTFDNHDMVLMGDIHRAQDLQIYDESGKPAVRYCGSLIQQKHDEPITGHGYSLWNLKDKNYSHVEVPNDCGFFTVVLEHGVISTSLSNIPKKARIRFQLKNTMPTEVKAALTTLRKTTEVIESSYEKLDEDVTLMRVLTATGNAVLGNINEQSYQESLIREYLKTRLNIIDPAFVDGVLKINKEINDSVKKDDFARNIRWIPIKFEWDNMFSYGEKNVVDFTKLKDVVGLFAANTSGKSSIFSALTFCLFDKCEREYEAVNIMNDQKTEFMCKFEFEIDGKRYFIERVGKADKRGKVKVNVKFWKVENGQEINLQGEQRRDTNETIRDYLGTYEDFVMTSLSVQNGKNNVSIIDMGKADRKDLFSQFMGLTIFDRLHTEANEHLKGHLVMLRAYKNDDYTQKLLDWTNLLSQAESLYREEIANLDVITGRKEAIQKRILEETQKLIKIDHDIPPLPQIEKQKNKLEYEITETKKGLAAQEIKVLEIQKLIDWIEKEIKVLEEKGVVEAYKNHQMLILKKTDIRWKLDNLKMSFENEWRIVNKAKDYEYDPKCKFCITNAGKIVSDAEKSKEKIKDYKEQEIVLKEVSDNIDTELKKSEWSSRSNETYQKLLGKRNTLKDELQLANTKKNNFVTDLRDIETDFKVALKNVEEYNKNKDSIDINGKINLQIEAFKQELSNTDQGYKTKNRTVMDMSSKISVCKSKITEINQKVDQVKEVEREYKLYEAYCQAVCRDGIPFDVITATVPEVQNEVNNILSQICEFTSLFETDGKNIIPYIVYGDRKWLMTSTSGFEKFALSIAIRVALTNISNLPKPNFLIIDEGFGVLDAENMSHMSTLFSYLKSNFDFVMVVSHLDSMRDVVDQHIEITKDNGFSKVEFI